MRIKTVNHYLLPPTPAFQHLADWCLLGDDPFARLCQLTCIFSTLLADAVGLGLRADHKRNTVPYEKINSENVTAPVKCLLYNKGKTRKKNQISTVLLSVAFFPDSAVELPLEFCFSQMLIERNS